MFSHCGIKTIDAFCYKITRKTIKNPSKLKKRKELLETNPNLKIDVDSQALCEIADFDFFLCSPICSIARGQAIEGSDIDRGIIISAIPISDAQQAEIVESLQAQGFDVKHVNDGGDIRFFTEQEILDLRRELAITNDVCIYYAGHPVFARYSNRIGAFDLVTEIKSKEYDVSSIRRYEQSPNLGFCRSPQKLSPY